MAFDKPSVNKFFLPRLEHLKITDIIEGKMEKGEALRSLYEQKGLSREEVLFVGDDIFDMGAFEEAGICVAVADAVEDVKKEPIM